LIFSRPASLTVLDFRFVFLPLTLFFELHSCFFRAQEVSVAALRFTLHYLWISFHVFVFPIRGIVTSPAGQLRTSLIPYLFFL